MNNEGYQITYTGEEVQELLDKAGTAVQTETDPTVPSWAKSSSKPSYNYSEISGTPTLANVATSGSYNDLDDKPTIPTVPTTLSSFTDDLGSSPTHTHSQYLTAHQDISGKENTSNKVTSLSSSSTDTQYPSAKCVWDLVGDIETLLAAI